MQKSVVRKWSGGHFGFMQIRYSSTNWILPDRLLIILNSLVQKIKTSAIVVGLFIYLLD